jgi:hypothetical protein
MPPRSFPAWWGWPSGPSGARSRWQRFVVFLPRRGHGEAVDGFDPYCDRGDVEKVHYVRSDPGKIQVLHGLDKEVHAPLTLGGGDLAWESSLHLVLDVSQIDPAAEDFCETIQSPHEMIESFVFRHGQIPRAENPALNVSHHSDQRSRFS